MRATLLWSDVYKATWSGTWDGDGVGWVSRVRFRRDRREVCVCVCVCVGEIRARVLFWVDMRAGWVGVHGGFFAGLWGWAVLL